jgi:hypothetical protein
LFLVKIGRGRAHQRIDIIGVDLKRLLKQSARRIVLVFRKRQQLKQGIAAHRRIDCVGVRGTRALFGFRFDKLVTQCVGQSSDHLILQLEQIG